MQFQDRPHDPTQGRVYARARPGKSLGKGGLTWKIASYSFLQLVRSLAAPDSSKYKLIFKFAVAATLNV